MLLGSPNLGGAGQEPKTSEDEGAGKGKGLGSPPPRPPSGALRGRISSRDFPCGMLSACPGRPREAAAQGRAQSLRRGDRKHTERRG